MLLVLRRIGQAAKHKQRILSPGLPPGAAVVTLARRFALARLIEQACCRLRVWQRLIKMGKYIDD
jgi:hypothetical protein